MSFQNLAVNSGAFLPRDLHNSLLCYTFVNCEAVEGAPNVTTCNSNGYLYEIKNKKILRTLKLDSNPSSIHCYYLLENEKLVVFYLVHFETLRLLVIKSTQKYLKVVKCYKHVKMFDVYDFYCLGYPEFEIFFQNKSDNMVCKFPVAQPTEPKIRMSGSGSSLAKSLSKNLEELHKYTDELIEDFNQLSKICFPNKSSIYSERIFIGTINFSSHLNETIEYKVMLCNKWMKVLGSNLILGMTFCNTGSEIIHDFEVIINHKNVTDYTYGFFSTTIDVELCLFSPLLVNSSLAPGEEICAVATFEVPKFYAESNLSILCHVSHGDLKDCLLKEIFEINISDIASQSTVDLEERFTVEDLLAIKVAKSETRFKIHTKDFEDGFMDSILIKNLGFKTIRHVKDKLFYCTSTYLKEVFVILQHVAVNPSVWKLVTYTSNEHQIYFLVNALYDLLPDNSVILCDENIK